MTWTWRKFKMGKLGLKMKMKMMLPSWILDINTSIYRYVLVYNKYVDSSTRVVYLFRWSADVTLTCDWRTNNASKWNKKDKIHNHTHIHMQHACKRALVNKTFGKRPWTRDSMALRRHWLPLPQFSLLPLFPYFFCFFSFDLLAQQERRRVTSHERQSELRGQSLQCNISFRLRLSPTPLLSHAHTHSLSRSQPVWQPYALAAVRPTCTKEGAWARGLCVFVGRVFWVGFGAYSVGATAWAAYKCVSRQKGVQIPLWTWTADGSRDIFLLLILVGHSQCWLNWNELTVWQVILLTKKNFQI